MKKNKKMERISVKNLSKKFKIGYNKEQSALSYLISLFSGIEAKKEFWALKDISFKVKAGEKIGIIGKNGSGKTILLGTIMGIYKPDKGKIKINKNAVLLSDLATGLKARLSIRDNIYLIGSILGLSQKNIKKNFNSIIEFAGLQDFVNTKIYQLSSGMKQRLTFSITMYYINHSKPDTLLLDEVFGGGGDEEFKNKALKKIEEIIKGDTTIVLASHRMGIIKKYCNRVIWLHKGKIKKEGGPEKVTEVYLKFIRKLRNTKEQNKE